MAIFMALEGHRRGDFQVLAFTLVAGNTKVENQPKNMLRILQLVPEIYGEVSNTDVTPPPFNDHFSKASTFFPWLSISS
jgi:inosine-uridine nucleoside N-ribohydrolase